MEERIRRLEQLGCDVRGTLDRMVGDEQFYLDCLDEEANDPNFSLLKEAIDRKDAIVAFERAHAIKGVVANLGLVPLYNKVVEMVEPLRMGKLQGMDLKYDEMMDVKKELLDK